MNFYSYLLNLNYQIFIFDQTTTKRSISTHVITYSSFHLANQNLIVASDPKIFYLYPIVCKYSFQVHSIFSSVRSIYIPCHFHLFAGLRTQLKELDASSNRWVTALNTISYRSMNLFDSGWISILISLIQKNGQYRLAIRKLFSVLYYLKRHSIESPVQVIAQACQNTLQYLRTKTINIAGRSQIVPFINSFRKSVFYSITAFVLYARKQEDFAIALAQELLESRNQKGCVYFENIKAQQEAYKHRGNRFLLRKRKKRRKRLRNARISYFK